MTETWCVARSKTDGQYLAARSQAASPDAKPDRYLLLFKEHADLLSYLNRHAPDLTPQFAMEVVPHNQLASLLNRWSYVGIAIVEDPWLPTVQFATLD